MTVHSEQESCLKEEQWRDVHEFIAGTKEYRKSLDESLQGIRSGMWAMALTVLVPFIVCIFWLGGLNKEVQKNTSDIIELKRDIKELSQR